MDPGEFRDRTGSRKPLEALLWIPVVLRGKAGSRRGGWATVDPRTEVRCWTLWGVGAGAEEVRGICGQGPVQQNLDIVGGEAGAGEPGVLEGVLDR